MTIHQGRGRRQRLVATDADSFGNHAINMRLLPVIVLVLKFLEAIHIIR